MKQQNRIALVGWNPDVVDYDKWPGLTPEKLRAALEGDRDKLNSLGYDAELLFITDTDKAFDTIGNALKKTKYDCVLIGAGVRTVNEHFHVFEQLVNAVHQHAPSAKICFNTNPTDTVEAVKRWI